jgi:hypothetical protein
MVENKKGYNLGFVGSSSSNFQCARCSIMAKKIKPSNSSLVTQFCMIKLKFDLFLPKKKSSSSDLPRCSQPKKKTRKKDRKRKKPKLQFGSEIELELQLGFFEASSSNS